MPQTFRRTAACLFLILWASTGAFAQPPIYYADTIAGATRAPDGVPGLDMALTRPNDLVFDGRGGVLFGENGIRRLDANGIITTIAPYTPINIAIDQFRRIFISDQTRVYRIESDGSRTPLAGSAPETCCTIPNDNVPALQVQLRISGFTVASDGSIYIAEGQANRIRKVDTLGFITTVAGTSFQGFSGDGGLAVNASLGFPASIRSDASGNLYFLDTFNDRIRRIGTDGIITTVAGNGSHDNPVSGQGANGPLGGDITSITISGSGDLYWSEATRAAVWRLNPAGLVQLVAGGQGPGYFGEVVPATGAQLNHPLGVAAGSEIWIADSDNGLIRRIDSAGVIRTVAGRQHYSGDGGKALQAQLFEPEHAITDLQGHTYIADTGNNRIRRVTPNGNIQTIAGTGVAGFSGDGDAAVFANINHPTALAFDPGGNLVFADTNNNRLRRITANGTITTIAGRDLPSDPNLAVYADGIPATDAVINPVSLAYDSSGNLYIAESSFLIRKIDKNGNIFTVAGIRAVSRLENDNQPAIGTSIRSPHHIAVDSVGNIYFSSWDGAIYRIGTNGLLSTFIRGGASISNEGGAVLGAVGLPSGLAVDSQGTLFFNDASANLVVQVVSGRLYRIGGTGKPYNPSERPLTGVPGSETGFFYPGGLSIDPSGGLVIADSGNHQIRRLAPRVTQAPAIRSIAMAGAFGGRAIVSPGAWLEIFGLNLAASAQQWSTPDFQAGVAPTALQGVSVKINGKSAFVSYVSPTQINIQAPDGPLGGTAIVQASGPGGVSNEFAIAAADLAPSLLAPTSFKTTKQYVTAIFPDGAYAGPPGLIPNVPFRRAKPGDILVLYGIGFGITDPRIPAGAIAAGITHIPSLTVSIGGQSAFEQDSLAPGLVGLYQFNIIVPPGLSGDQKLEMTVGTTKTQQELWLALE